MVDVKKTRVMHKGKMVDAIQTNVVTSKEDWNEFTLDDGTVIRAKMSLLSSAARIEGEWDEQGNPTYSLQLTPAIGIASAPADLKKPSDSQ